MKLAQWFYKVKGFSGLHSWKKVWSFLKFPLPIDSLCKVWLKWLSGFRKKKDFHMSSMSGTVNVFIFTFLILSPLGKGISLLFKLISLKLGLIYNDSWLVEQSYIKRYAFFFFIKEPQ